MEENKQQSANTEDTRKKFNLPDNAMPLVITFLTPGDTPEEFKVGIFVNEHQPQQLIRNTLAAVIDILDKKPTNITGPNIQQQGQRKPTLKDFIED